MQQALSVSQLNQYIRLRLEQDEVLQQVCVSGELSNVTLHRSGHIYLKLKDEKSVISGVMFRFSAANLDFVPKDGMSVTVFGTISVYEPSGSYQIKISVMKQTGLGDLMAQFENRKKKLSEMGLFDERHKRPLPQFPKVIGVITSPTGAAIRDIIRVCSRRYPAAEIVLYPALVQGNEAAASLVRAVEWFDANRAADVLIVGRGGGSIEDLWCFNDEALAYAIYNCEIPTVSAVGHEIDYTICDFVADVRAATPSMAGELVCPDQNEYFKKISWMRSRLSDLLGAKYSTFASKFQNLQSNAYLSDPEKLLSRYSMRLDQATSMLVTKQQAILQQYIHRFDKDVVKLDALSPLKTLSRGFATVTDHSKIVSDFSDLAVGNVVTVRLKNSEADCEIKEIRKA